MCVCMYIYIYMYVCDFPIKTPFIYSRFEQLSPLMTGGYGIFFHGPAEKSIGVQTWGLEGRWEGNSSDRAQGTGLNVAPWICRDDAWRMVEEPYSEQTSTIVQQYMINPWALSCLKHFEPFPVDIRSKGLYHSKWVQNSFQVFFGSGFGFLFWLSFLVPFALYLQQFGTIVESVILHGICMNFATFWHGHFAFCTLFATFGHVCLPFCMIFATFWRFNLSFAWYLLHFGTSNVHVDFLRVSLGFSLGFHLGFHLEIHLGFL